jgi:hypothetical protein|tara:strand:- start:267 stop:605 length:339 start_codon:yes stop_codon:yes gene_type:complete
MFEIHVDKIVDVNRQFRSNNRSHKVYCRKFMMVRTRRANRYCVDCGSRLVYYPRLSNPKAPNEHRILVYACPDCTDDFEKPKMFSIKRNQVEEPLETVEIEITQLHKKIMKN